MGIEKVVTFINNLQKESQFLPVDEVLKMREKLTEPAIICWINAKTKDRILRLVIKAVTWILTYLITILLQMGVFQ